MSYLSTLFIALIKPIILGVVVAGMLLLFFPEFREGKGLNLNWLTQQAVVPERLSYYDALSKSAPSVVNIYSLIIEDSNRLFRSRRERSSLGSGVIMREDGYILTCYHVIKGADSIFVAAQHSSSPVQAQLVGFDEVTDLAVLRVFNDNLPVIPQLPDPDLRVGDVVMAIGNPLDLGQTVTSGIVSRISRNILANFFDFIQTDAVLNQGNSGGALIDSNGYLVGITNANFTTIDNRRRTQDVDGVNFAVPYSVAKRVMDTIIENGRVIRGQLGFSGESFPNIKGIVVDRVDANSPAQQAGLRVNDVIVAVDGKEIASVADATAFLTSIESTEPGTEVTLIVNRDDQILSLNAIVREFQST